MSELAMRIGCPYCGAGEGVACVTSTGKATRGSHNQRWTEWRWALRNRRSRMQLLRDDPRFKLSAGDILICQPYPYDAKWTVLYREGDSFEPECNQYTHDVKWVGWAS